MIKRYVPVLILSIAVVIIQILFSLAHAEYYLTQLTMSAYYGLVIMGLCLLMGYTGQISIGHAGFFAIGGYTSSVLTTLNLFPFQQNSLVVFIQKCGLLLSHTDLYGEPVLYLNPWIAFGVAVAITIIIAFCIGIPVLKLKGHYLAMATLGFGSIIYTIVMASHIFGESDGISDIPAFTLLPGLSVSGNFTARVQNYYIAFAWVIAALLIIINLIHSRVGRALRAIHANEEAANSAGIDIARYKLATFVLSAVLAAIGGIFSSHYNGGIGPSEAGVIKSIRYVAIVAVGGMANIWGCLIMGIILNFLSLRGYFGTLDDAVFGAILICIMLFAPKGILGMNLVERLRKIVIRKQNESA